MPKTKKTRFTKKGKKSMDKKSLVKRVAKIEKEFKPELKYMTQTEATGIGPRLLPPTSTEVYPTTSIWQLFPITQGPTGTERIGNQIKGDHIMLKYSLTNLTNGVQINNMYCHIMIIFDKASNESNLNALAEVQKLFDQDAVNFQYLDFNNQFNNEYKKRFTILHDKIHEIGRLPATGTTVGTTYVKLKRRISTKFITKYNPSAITGLPADIATGTYYMLYKPVQTENTGAVVAGPQLHYSARFFFSDA